MWLDHIITDFLDQSAGRFGAEGSLLTYLLAMRQPLRAPASMESGEVKTGYIDIASEQHRTTYACTVRNQTIFSTTCTLTPVSVRTELPDDHSEREPPDPFPNSAVKPLSADGSVGFPHVRVGHCQASY